MKVELFYSPGCRECAAAQAGLKEVARKAAGSVDWREINVLDRLDYAVQLGVLTLPSIAIDGKLAFSSLPTPRQLRKALAARAAGEM